MSDYKRFREETSTTLIDYSGVDPKTVFDKYFKKSAPFGRGDKKAEFPDAFMIEAIKAMDITNKFIIVSQDNDWKKSFEGTEIKVVDGINALITDIIKNVDSEKYEATMDYISTVEFREQFESDSIDEIYNLEIDVNIDECIDTIEIIDAKLVKYKFESFDYIDADTIEIMFLMNADITVEYTFFDEENSVYDSIDHEYAYHHTAEFNEVHRVGLEMVVTLDINDNLQNLVISYYSTVLNETELLLDENSQKERTRTDIAGNFGGYYDFESELVGNSSDRNDLMICPDCGKRYDYRNDGGNGFCSICGPNH